jgi:hypothetical protein
MNVYLHLAEGMRKISDRLKSSEPEIKMIYKSPAKHILKPKAIAFDLDETIGSFTDFCVIWQRLDPETKTQQTFNAILDMFPEFFRAGIFQILDFIYSKIESGNCLPIYIYTNNQCQEQSWIERLVSYLEMRMRNGKPVVSDVFARPICAFKVRDVRVEMNRTSHEKTYSDFVRCSMLKHTDVCFLDDQFHSKMVHRRVYYIQPPPYVHRLSPPEISDRLVAAGFPAYTRIPYSIREPNLAKNEKEISSKIMYYVREFFLISMRRCLTKKRRRAAAKFSHKKYARLYCS